MRSPPPPVPIFPSIFRAALLLLAAPMASVRGEALPSLDSAPAARRAIAAMQAQQWKPARSAWEAVLKLEPDNAAALSNLGKVQYQLGEHEAARKSLEKATQLKPELTDSWLALGLVYLELKAPMMAVSATTRGVAENPADPRAHNSLAIILKRIGWTNGAEAELQKALDLDPNYSEAHFNLAVMYLERKPPSLEMAGRHYRKARALGAPPDEVIEKQIRGEAEIEETDSAPVEEEPPTASTPELPSPSNGKDPAPAKPETSLPKSSPPPKKKKSS